MKILTETKQFVLRAIDDAGPLAYVRRTSDHDKIRRHFGHPTNPPPIQGAAVFTATDDKDAIAQWRRVEDQMRKTLALVPVRSMVISRP